MRIMREKGIFAVPTFTISEYFGNSASSRAEQELLDLHVKEFQKQLAAGVSDGDGLRRGSVPARHAST